MIYFSMHGLKLNYILLLLLAPLQYKNVKGLIFMISGKLEWLILKKKK